MCVQVQSIQNIVKKIINRIFKKQSKASWSPCGHLNIETRRPDSYFRYTLVAPLWGSSIKIHLHYSKPILNKGPSKCFFISLSKMLLVIWNFTITYSNATPKISFATLWKNLKGLNEQEIDYSWKGNDHKYLKVANFVLGMPTF